MSTSTHIDTRRWAFDDGVHDTRRWAFDDGGHDILSSETSWLSRRQICSEFASSGLDHLDAQL